MRANTGPDAPDPDAASLPAAGIFGLDDAPESAATLLIPVPLEATVSYGEGTAAGPRAILTASHQVELLDLEHGRPWEAGIAMLPQDPDILRLAAEARRLALPLIREGGCRGQDAAQARLASEVDGLVDGIHQRVRALASTPLDRGQLVGVVGGDHSVAFGLLAELADRHETFGVLQVDAHADMRVAYEGFLWSHASIMHEVLSRLPQVSRLTQLGIRDIGQSELTAIESAGARVVTFFDHAVRADLLRARCSWDAVCQRVVASLPDLVHVSIDVDGLSPALCPNTGTPVPGGLSWSELCHLLVVLAESGKRVIGFDLCEVAPGPAGDERDASVGARLLYKLIACAQRTRS